VTNVLVALDQLGNAILRGSPDETISSRAGKCAWRYEHGEGQPGDKKWWYLCKLLHLIDRNHCFKNIELDEGKPAPSDFVLSMDK
jgi:hypothetical protein